MIFTWIIILKYIYMIFKNPYTIHFMKKMMIKRRFLGYFRSIYGIHYIFRQTQIFLCSSENKREFVWKLMTFGGQCMMEILNDRVNCVVLWFYCHTSHTVPRKQNQYIHLYTYRNCFFTRKTLYFMLGATNLRL